MNKCEWNILIFLLVISMLSCRNSRDSKGAAIAKVNGEYLYEKDLFEVMPKGLKKDDSLFFVHNFIASWVKEELIYKEADNILSSMEKNKDKEVHDYYRSLLRQELLKKVVNKNLDRNVTEKEIEAYYSENKKNFELKRNIIRFIYIKTRTDAPNRANAKEWIRIHDKKSMENLRDYSRNYAINSNLDTTAWYYFDDIMKEIPLRESYDPEHFVRNNSYVELRDASYLYILNVIDNRIKDGISPLNLVRSRIKNIILNKRKVLAIQNFEDKIYKEAFKQKQFEDYTK